MQERHNFMISPELDRVPATPQLLPILLVSAQMPPLLGSPPRLPWCRDISELPAGLGLPHHSLDHPGSSTYGCISLPRDSPCSTRHPIGQTDSVNETPMALRAWPPQSFLHSAKTYQGLHPTLGCQAYVREASAWPCCPGAPSLRQRPRAVSSPGLGDFTDHL